MASHFLTTTHVAPANLVRLGDVPAVAQWEALERLLATTGDGAAANLFAQPVLGKAGAEGVTVAWYSSRPGTGRRLSDLAGDSRALAEDTLRERLAAIAPALRDAETAPLLGAALLTADPDDVMVVDGEPIVINWGMAPPQVVADPAARTAHFNAGLGRFLPLDAAPPLSMAEWRARGGTAVQAAGVAAATYAAAARPMPPPVLPQAAAIPASGPVFLAEPAPVTGRWRWVPLLALLGVSLAALIWLLQPGTRLFPPPPAPQMVADADAERILAEVNRTLEDRVRALREAVAGAVCTVDGTLVLPDGRTAEGLMPPPPDATAEAIRAPRAGAADALVPPDPGRVEVPRAAPDGTAQPEVATLLQIIEDQTVLVMALAGERSGTGSGFFVGPDLVVTNHHVIVAAMETGGDILVANQRLGRVHTAQVVASLGPLMETGGDFALLRVPGVASPYYTLRAATDTMRLQNVIAAGYPGAILDSDANFRRLREGDATAIPELSVTQGIVNTEQDLGPATRAMIHTAVISPGNSGGPLVDSCGRAVGVNTFGRTLDQRHLNFALVTTDLIRFLEAHGVAPRTETGPCAPTVRPPVAAPRTAAAEPDAADPPAAATP